MGVKKLLALFFFAYIPLLLAQEEKVYFDDALALHLRTFNNKSDWAIKNQMPNKVDVLFDSLVKNHLKHTYVSDVKLKKVSGGSLHTDEIDQPFLLITKSSAIIQSKQEIETINTLANEYVGKVKIIVLYWEKRAVAKKNAKKYNKNITVVYADERYNVSNKTLSVYKHSFGVPACFYINRHKQMSHIDRKFFLRNLKAATQQRFAEKAHRGIHGLLQVENIVTESHPSADLR